MYKKKKILALITARGGSKGLPGKNIKPLLGKPLIAWSIEQALSSRYIDKLIVSTDSPEIASVAAKYGAPVPFLRPKELAIDTAKSMDVVFHALDFLESKDDFYDILVLLEPTSPLRDTQDIDKAIEVLMANRGAESIVGIARVESTHPAFLAEIKRKFLRPYLKRDFKAIRRQEIDDLYFFEGSLYIAHVGSLRKRKQFYHTKTLGHVLPKWKSFEMDDFTDFCIIEALMAAKLKGMLKGEK